MQKRPARWLTSGGLACAIVVLGFATAVTGHGRIPGGQIALACLFTVPGLGLGEWLVLRGQTVVGALLVMLGALPLFLLGPQDISPDPASLSPFARGLAIFDAGSWIWLYIPPALLAAVFPDGRLPSRRWRWLPVAWVVFVVMFQVSVALDPGTYGNGAGQVPGEPPVTVPGSLIAATGFASLALLLGLLSASAAAVVVRYRRGSDRVRRQLKWFALSVLLLPLVLIAAWLSYLFTDAAGTVVVIGLLAVFLSVPVAVSIAVVRHELYDVDRLFSRAVTYTAVSGLLTGTFALVTVLTGLIAGRGSRLSVAVATLVCASAFGPVRRRIQAIVDARFDRDRENARARLAQFVSSVRDGTAEPEAVDDALRAALRDPGLLVAYAGPGGQDGAWYDGAGRSTAPPGAPFVDVAAGERLLGRVGYDAAARRPQLVDDLVREAHLPLEIAWYRIALKHALAETEASRARLLTAGDAERRRLERDIHDGAQQRLVAIGMSLRLAQQRAGVEESLHHDLGVAVTALQEAIVELRRLAAGIRPTGLDEGLTAALRTLVRASPVPIGVHVGTPSLPDVVSTTVYYVAAEAVANALKHASPGHVQIDVTRADGVVQVVVADDGCGGAVIVPGSGLAGLDDRIAATGGTLLVLSEPGQGTRVEARLPCAS